MTSPRRPAMALDAETLLAHGAWLAKLARALVARDDEIEDVVQQTYAQALDRPPRDARNVRGWLGTIARNVVRSNVRSRSARVAREIAVPAPPPVETPVEAVERAELRRMVVESVLALDEPYRSAVILRFFEEQEVAAIARLTSAGEETVRTRLRRGVQRVREILERKVDEGSRGAADEGAAARAILFLRLREIAAGSGGGGASGSAAAARGFSRSIRDFARDAVARRIAAAAAIVVVVAGGWWWRSRNVDGAPSHGSDAPGRTLTATAPAPAAPPPAEVDVERASDAANDAPALAPPHRPSAPPAPRATIRGTIFDPDGKPVAHAHVWAIVSPSHENENAMPEFGAAARTVAEDPPPAGTGGWTLTKSDEAGRYEIAGLSIVPGWAIGAYEPTAGAAIADVRSFDRRHLEAVADVRLVRGTILRGSVRDESGAPVGGARVFLFTTCGSRSTRATLLTQPIGEAVGTFDAGFRCGDALEIGCGTPGFLPTKRGKITILPDTTSTDFKITLKRRPGIVVRGRIVDPTGLPMRLEPLLAAQFPSISPLARWLKASVWAIGPGAKRPPLLLAGVATGEGIVEGRVDFVAGEYDVVVPDGFRGALELRIATTLVGRVPLDDPTRAPDLPCDERPIPKPDPATTFVVRYVDEESKEPIDLARHDLLPYSGEPSTTPMIDSVLDPGHGLVRYRCAAGSRKLMPLLLGYALSESVVDVPAQPRDEPITIELAKANAGVRGFVFHEDGTPRAKATISIFRPTPTGMLALTSDLIATNGDGEFEFEPLAAREHVVVASGQPDEAPGVARFLPADPPADVDVHTRAGTATVFRLVARGPGGDLADAILRIVDEDGVVLEDSERVRAMRTGSPDRFVVTLADGSYTAKVECNGRRDAAVEFVVPAKDAIEIPLEPAQRRE